MSYTEEQRAADAEIAVAMGWQEIAKNPASFPPRITGIPPYGCKIHGLGGCGRFEDVPHFHADESARRALLEWLAADETQWHKFDHAFFEQFIGQRDLDFVQIAFLATPAQIAEAALRVIKEGECK